MDFFGSHDKKGYYLSPKQGMIRRYRRLQQRHPLQADFWLFKVDLRQFDQCETNSHFVNSYSHNLSLTEIIACEIEINI